MQQSEAGIAGVAVGTWSSWHLHVQTGGGQALDDILRAVVAPVVAEFAVDGSSNTSSRQWFFLRYWQYGPHLRLRIADLDAEQSASVSVALSTAMAAAVSGLDDSQRMDQDGYARIVAGIARTGEGGRSMAVGTLEPAGVLVRDYEPEFERYGGPALLPLSEELFHLASGAALQACLHRPGYARHLGDGLEAMAATVSAWPGDRRQLLQGTRDGWSSFMRGAGVGNVAAVEEFAAAKAAALSGIADRFEAISRGAPTRWSAWTDRLGSACQIWVTDLGWDRAAGVFASHLHMMQNRLGVAAGREAFLAATLLKLLFV